MASTTPLTPEALERLRLRLPRGAASVAADRLRGRFSRPYIYMVLNGSRYNQTVMDVLLAIAEEHEAETEQLNARAMGPIR